MKKFNKGWCNKVMQAQASLYTKTTKGAWIIRFEDIVAEAKESGPLKNNDIDIKTPRLIQFNYSSADFAA